MNDIFIPNLIFNCALYTIFHIIYTARERGCVSNLVWFWCVGELPYDFHAHFDGLVVLSVGIAQVGLSHESLKSGRQASPPSLLLSTLSLQLVPGHQGSNIVGKIHRCVVKIMIDRVGETIEIVYNCCYSFHKDWDKQ